MRAGDSLRSKFGDNMREAMVTRPSVPIPTGGESTRSTRRDAPSLKRALLIPIDRIQPDPNQPRKEFDQGSLQELAESLKTRGQLQPVRVRWDESSGNWILITGERRWRAAQLAKISTLQAVEVDGTPSETDTLIDQLQENCVRAGLLPIEQANAFKALMDALGLTHRQLAERLHIAHSAVTQALALLRLPEEVQKTIESGAIAPATAYEISKLENPTEQVKLATKATNEKLTRTAVIEEVRAQKGKKQPNPNTPPSTNQRVNIQEQQQSMTVVEIKLDQNCTISITGVQSDAGPEAILVILRRAVDHIKSQIASTI